MESEELNDDLFKNWVRSSKGLEYFKEGLQEFVGEKVLQSRNKTLLMIKLKLPLGSPQQCNQCTALNLSPDHSNTTKACDRHTCHQHQKSIANCFGSKPVGRRKCPSGICSKFYDAIIDEHVFKDPLWKNTDPSTWCLDPNGWSYAKCFQTTKDPGTSAKDTDAASLLNIIINNRSIQNFVTSINPHTTSSFHTARDIRNKILHSPKLEIDETTLCSYLDAFILVLQDPKCLLYYESSKTAVQKLTQLKNNKIHITQGETVSLLEKRNKALTELDEKTAESLSKLNDKLYKSKQNIDDSKNTALADVKNAGILVKQTLSVEQKVAISDITSARKHGIQDIAGKTYGALSEINTAKKHGIQDIAGKTYGALSEINTAKKHGIQDIAGKTYGALSEINTARKQAQKQTNKQTKKSIFKAKHDIDGQKRKAISDIFHAKSEVVSAITKAGAKTKEDVLMGASAAFPNTSAGSYFFQKGLRKFNKVSSLKLYYQGVPSRPREVSELKDELITWYNKTHSTVALSPLTGQFPTPLVGFYIMPEIDVQTYLPGGKKERNKVKSLQDLFSSGRKSPREIYLSAVAGFGKTAFSKYLALAWCQAHQNDENYKYFKKEELKALSGFDFLFLVILRNSAEVCNVDDMIEQQVIKNLPCSSSARNAKALLRRILHDETCLVILDGLDEWTHPDNDCSRQPKDIPHRYARKKCVILTTTRPWKLGMLDLITNQIDKTVELVKLSEDNALQFKCNAMKMLNVDLQDDELTKKMCRFEEEISDHCLEDMESTPLLLLYLICLWVEKIPIGNSAVELYTCIIQLLLSRTEKLHGEFHSSYTVSPQSNVPECFRKHKQLYRYHRFLVNIGRLAFYTLFSTTKEHTLVFDESFAEQYLNEEDFNSGYLTGILSKSQVKTLINESFKISFVHKSLQEYFSAIFISFQNSSKVQKIILAQCNSLRNILDMSKVFVFISSMNPKLMSEISSYLIPAINNDTRTSTYRTLTYYDYMYIDPLQDIQDIHISCAMERKENKDNSLYLQDFFINEKCQQVNYFKQLQHMCQESKETVKSMMIENEGICSLQEIINLFSLPDLPNIQKLYYQGEIVKEEMMSLLLNPLKCLTVISNKWESQKFVEAYYLLPKKIYGRLAKLHHLECLCIQCFTMTHDVMEGLLNYLTSKKSMKEITLYSLYCDDHDASCSGFNLDLSQHSYLRCLGLGDIPVSKLNLEVALLEECSVGVSYKPGVVSSWLRSLQAASKLHTFRCSDLESSSDIETMLKTLPLLLHLKEVMLLGINLGERSLKLSSKMSNIELVDLCDITMSFSVLHDLITVIKKLQQPVTVYIRDCHIKPEDKFENFKTSIKQSDDYVVTFDDTVKSGEYRFVFKTTKLT